MRSYYIRRKDLDHVPFQFYVGADGVARSLGKGYTAAFVLIPPKNQVDVVYVGVMEDLSHALAETWGVGQGDLLRVAAKAVEAWLKNEKIPDDHVVGPEWLKLDLDWYPRDEDGSPALAENPYTFQVDTDEPAPSILDWDFKRREDDPVPAVEPAPVSPPQIVFGFTLDVFPGMLILGYQQLKRKALKAGVPAEVKIRALSDLPENVHTLFVPNELEQATHLAAPNARVYALTEMINLPVFDTVIQEFSQSQATTITTESSYSQTQS